MLKLELKRIFSKKINVFAIGLALILAVIFSGFAVTSNPYVDENGNDSTGVWAIRDRLQVIAMWMRMEMLVLELWQQENLQITDEHGKVH